jgi:hypothetical protein
LEARIARIESDVAHMRTDIADIKVDLRSVRDKLDSTGGAACARLERNIDELQAIITRVQIRAAVLFIVFAGTMLGVMAHGFGWI